MARDLCVVCGGVPQAERKLFDDRYGYPGEFRLMRCPICGHRRLDVRMSVAQIADLYTRFYPRSSFAIEAWMPHSESTGLVAWWQGHRANAYRWVPRGVRVLDIGCGFGESLGYHRARGCDAHGVEADANILRVAERHGLQVQHGLFDPERYEACSFDVVTLDQVVEHVAEPDVVLRGIHRVLKQDGLLVLSTPDADGMGVRMFGRRWIHWHAPYHLQFFSRKSMVSLAAASGFRIERSVSVTQSAWLHFQWAHLITCPTPGMPSSFWSGKRPQSLRQRVLLKLAHWANRAGINALLTRLFDTLGCGDNRVWLLRKELP